MATADVGAAYPHAGRRIRLVAGGADADALSPLRRPSPLPSARTQVATFLGCRLAYGLAPSGRAQRTGGTVSNAADVAAHNGQLQTRRRSGAGGGAGKEANTTSNNKNSSNNITSNNNNTTNNDDDN